MTCQATIQPLTAAAFAPFGTVLEPPARDTDIATDFNRYWDGPVPYRVTGPPLLGFLEAYWRPLVVTWMEFHRTHTQGFIPLGGQPFVFAVAPPDAEPANLADKVQAFFLNGDVGVILHERVWHHLLFPLVPRAHALILLQEGTRENDMNVSQLPEPVELVQSRLG